MNEVCATVLCFSTAFNENTNILYVVQVADFFRGGDENTEAFLEIISIEDEDIVDVV